MKGFFTGILVLNLLIEGMAAVSLLAGAEGVMAQSRPDHGMWPMNYGFAALAIATMVLWIWPYRDNYAAVSTALGFLMTFHTGLFISLLLSGEQMVGMVLHGIMAVLCVFAFVQRSRWCSPPATA